MMDESMSMIIPIFIIILFSFLPTDILYVKHMQNAIPKV